LKAALGLRLQDQLNEPHQEQDRFGKHYIIFNQNISKKKHVN